jgi:hypothetical protein
VRVSITSPLVQPSPNGRRVGIRIVTFEACSGFTRVTARRIAQPPKVTFVTRLRSRQLPSETARQLPDLSTIIRVEPSSTDDSRLQGALPIADIPGWPNIDVSLRPPTPPSARRPCRPRIRHPRFAKREKCGSARGSIGPLWVQLSLVREYRARVERALASLVPEADRNAHQEMKLYAALGRDHASTWLGASDDLHEWLSRGHRQKEWGFKPSAAGREEGESLFGKMGTVKEATKAVSKRWPILRGTEGSNPAPSTGESIANLTFSIRGAPAPPRHAWQRRSGR